MICERVAHFVNIMWNCWLLLFYTFFSPGFEVMGGWFHFSPRLEIMGGFHFSPRLEIMGGWFHFSPGL
jgi:hypothetical protein